MRVYVGVNIDAASRKLPKIRDGSMHELVNQQGQECMTQKSQTGTDEQTSSAATKRTAPNASKGMTPEERTKELSQHPLFRKVGKSGDGFIIVGGKR
jgi:hypothetical protein